MENDEPICANDNTEYCPPWRMKLLIEKDEDNTTKFKIEQFPAILVLPRSDNEDPKRPKALTDIALPSEQRSKTDIA